MTKSSIAALLVALFFSTASHAQVYQCPGKDGKPVFTDRPCAAGQQVDVKPVVPSEEEHLKSKIRDIQKQIAAEEAIQKARKETAQIVARREALQAERKRQCDYYTRDYQHYETSGKYSYFRNNRAMYFEKARQAYEGVKKYCD